MDMMTPVAEALNRYLDLSSMELKVTAQNMANVDTPGYRTLGFDFAAEMKQSLQQLGQAEKNGATERLVWSEDRGLPRVGPIGGLLERPDGNDVSMDREGIKIAEAQLQFHTGAELLKHEFTRVMDAIHEDQR